MEPIGRSKTKSPVRWHVPPNEFGPDLALAAGAGTVSAASSEAAAAARASARNLICCSFQLAPGWARYFLLETARSIRPAALVVVAEQLDHRAEVPSGQPLWRAAGHERSAEGVLRRVCVGVLRTDDVAGLVIEPRGKDSRCVDAREARHARQPLDRARKR